MELQGVATRAQAEQLKTREALATARATRAAVPVDPLQLTSWYQEKSYKDANHARHAPVRCPWPALPALPTPNVAQCA